MKMKMKILAPMAFLAITSGVAQAAIITINGSHTTQTPVSEGGLGDLSETYFFDATGTGSVDMFMAGLETHDFLIDGETEVTHLPDIDVFANTQLIVWKNIGSDYELMGFNNHAPRKAGPTANEGPITIYDTPVNGYTGDEQPTSGIADPGLTLNLDAGRYMLTVEDSENNPIGTLFSEGIVSVGTGDEGTFTNPYTLTIRGDFVTEAAVVPVPAAFWLFGTAVFGFLGFSRRK